MRWAFGAGLLLATRYAAAGLGRMHVGVCFAGFEWLPRWQIGERLIDLDPVKSKGCRETVSGSLQPKVGMNAKWFRLSI